MIGTTRDAANADAEGDGQPETSSAGYFAVEAMPRSLSPDPRCVLEHALEILAAQLRPDPTLPADTADPAQASRAALLEDAAVQLPRKHCAFKRCVWCGPTDADLHAHLVEQHSAALDGVASLLSAAFDLDERRYSSYNEAIAAIVRRGAPLATYSIDRRSLRSYAECLSDDGVESLICFSCARRFPFLASWEPTMRYIGGRR